MEKEINIKQLFDSTPASLKGLSNHGETTEEIVGKIGKVTQVTGWDYNTFYENNDKRYSVFMTDSIGLYITYFIPCTGGICII